MAALERQTGHHLPRETLDAIVDAMADPLFVKNDEHRFILVNRALCQMLRLTREQLIGKTDYDFFSREEADVFRAKDEEVMREGGVNVNREQLTDQDGTTRVIVTKKTAYTGPDGRKILVGTIRDITDQHEAEQALRRAHDELELRVQQRTREVEEAEAQLRRAQKMEAIGQLTGGLAHDFNNLLTVIIGNLDLLGVGSFDREISQRLLDEAFDAAERGAELIQHMLAFSRQQVLRAQITDIGALLHRMLPLVRRSLGESIIVEIHTPEEPLNAQIDAGQLETAVLNLAINARDATSGAGRLEFELSALDIDRQTRSPTGDIEPGSWLLLEVSDTGTGMPPEVRERVFDPFFTTKGNRGSGLGLSMVYGFVKQSGGHVNVFSVVGAGTIFQIYLPRADSDVPIPRDHPRSLPVLVGGSERLLVIEDDAAVRSYIVRVADNLGYEVLEAANLDEARELLRTRPDIDLLVCDVVLEDGPVGRSFVEAAIAEDPRRRALLVSGYSSETLGVGLEWSLLSKPFRMRELATAIRDALERP